MPTTSFDKGQNRFAAVLAAAYTPGDPTISLSTATDLTGQSLDAPNRLVFGTFTGQTPVTETVLTVIRFTSVNIGAKTVSGLSAVDGYSLVSMPAGTEVQVRASKGLLQQITGAINALETIGGPQGPQGYQGQAGSAGVQGVQGATGNTGPQGNQGLAGSNGSQGSQGPQGYQGSSGSTGPQGNQGATGSGSQGPQGNQGTAGSTGPQGNQGATGSGSQGPQGVAGSTGSQGPQGNQGFQGVTGSGSQGPQGYQGYQGASGGGGGGSPAGSNTQIQYNNSGSFGASPYLYWDDTNKSLVMWNTKNGLVVQTDQNANYSSGLNLTSTIATTGTQYGIYQSGVCDPNASLYGYYSSYSAASGNPYIVGFGLTVPNNAASYAQIVQGRSQFQVTNTGHDTLTLAPISSQTGKLLALTNTVGSVTSYFDASSNLVMGSSQSIGIRIAPTYPLHVKTTNNTNTAYFEGTTTGGGAGGLQIIGLDSTNNTMMTFTQGVEQVWVNGSNIRNNYSETQYLQRRTAAASSGTTIAHRMLGSFVSDLSGTATATVLSVELSSDASTTSGKKLLQEWKNSGTKASVDLNGRIQIGVVSTAPSDSPATGTMVYCSGDGKMYLYNGSAWKSWTPA